RDRRQWRPPSRRRAGGWRRCARWLPDGLFRKLARTPSAPCRFPFAARRSRSAPLRSRFHFRFSDPHAPRPKGVVYFNTNPQARHKRAFLERRPMNKSYRLGQILNVVRSQRVRTQEELSQALRKLNVHATQVTLSRDIRELGLVKTSQGYAVAEAVAAPT